MDHVGETKLYSLGAGLLHVGLVLMTIFYDNQQWKQNPLLAARLFCIRHPTEL